MQQPHEHPIDPPGADNPYGTSEQPAQENRGDSDLVRGMGAATVSTPSPNSAASVSATEIYLPGNVVDTPTTGIRYLQSYAFMFNHPNWFINILLLALVALIPIIGYIIVYGYIYEVVESMHRRPKAMFPKFDPLERFLPYLARGAWPWIIMYVGYTACSLVNSLVSAVVMLFVMWLGNGLAPDREPLVLGAAMASMYAVMFVMMAGFFLILVPLMTRAGLSQDFAKAFNFAWIRDYFRRVWFELILCVIFLAVTSILLSLVGFALLFVTVFVTSILIALAMGHLEYQLYHLYLARGGEPIELKADQPPAVS